MSTLSDRLRAGWFSDGVLRREFELKAADELDRLTARVAELERVLQWMVNAAKYKDEAERYYYRTSTNLNEERHAKESFDSACSKAIELLEHKHD